VIIDAILDVYKIGNNIYNRIDASKKNYNRIEKYNRIILL